MTKKFARLDRIVHNEPITKENSHEFLYQLQCSLLLALRERGTLSPMQHRHAQERLKQQRRELVRREQEKS